jgi:hypothetical protein
MPDLASLIHYSTEEKQQKRPRDLREALVEEQRGQLLNNQLKTSERPNVDNLRGLIILGQMLVITGAWSTVAATYTAVRFAINNRRLPSYGNTAICTSVHFS